MKRVVLFTLVFVVLIIFGGAVSTVSADEDGCPPTGPDLPPPPPGCAEEEDDGVPRLPESDYDEPMNDAPILDLGQKYGLYDPPDGFHFVNVPEAGSVVEIDYSGGTDIDPDPYVDDNDAGDPVGTFHVGWNNDWTEDPTIKFVSTDSGLQGIDMGQTDYLVSGDDEPPIGYVTIDTIPPESNIFTVESVSVVPQEITQGESITIQGEISYNRDDIVNSEDGKTEIVAGGEVIDSQEISPSLDSTTRISTTYEPEEVDEEGNIPITVRAAPEWKEVDEGTEEQTSVIVDTPPIAAIDCSPDSIIEDQSVECSGSDSSDEGRISSYDWDFGEGSSSSGETATHTYDTPGEYEVDLTVTDDSGQTATESTTIEVDEAVAPSAEIDCSPTSVTAGESISCSAAESSDEDTSIQSYEWSFGAGVEATATGVSTEHTYEEPGTYTTELEVTDETGLTDTATTTIDVSRKIPPSAEISCSPDSVFAGETISCSAGESSDEDGTIQSYEWDFESGEELTSNEPSIQYSYDESGTYNVELTVTDNTGETDSDTTTVNVEENEAPRASFEITSENPTVNERITFDASTSTDDNGIATYSWDLGNGDEATGAVIERNYEQPGEYTVTLETTDKVGNSDIEEKTVFVSPMFTDFSIRSIPESANDPAELTFSTTNQLGNRPAKVQLFLSTPDEVTITRFDLPPDWSTGKSATIVSNEPLQPGESEEMQMDVLTTENGTYTLDGEVVYLIGDEEEKIGPISTAPVEMCVGPCGEQTQDSSPGFGIPVAIISGLLIMLFFIRKK